MILYPLLLFSGRYMEPSTWYYLSLIFIKSPYTCHCTPRSSGDAIRMLCSPSLEAGGTWQQGLVSSSNNPDGISYKHIEKIHCCSFPVLCTTHVIAPYLLVLLTEHIENCDQCFSFFIILYNVICLVGLICVLLEWIFGNRLYENVTICIHHMFWIDDLSLCYGTEDWIIFMLGLQ